jgi:hypothetical protein
MSDFIILTAVEADTVRGPTAAFAALDPVEREGAVFILGVEVLADPAHAEHHDYLAALPVMADDDAAFPPAKTLTTASLRPRGQPRKP